MAPPFVDGNPEQAALGQLSWVNECITLSSRANRKLNGHVHAGAQAEGYAVPMTATSGHRGGARNG